MPRAFNNAPSLDHPRHLKSVGTPSPAPSSSAAAYGETFRQILESKRIATTVIHFRFGIFFSLLPVINAH